MRSIRAWLVSFGVLCLGAAAGSWLLLEAIHALAGMAIMDMTSVLGQEGLINR